MKAVPINISSDMHFLGRLYAVSVAVLLNEERTINQVGVMWRGVAVDILMIKIPAL